MFTRVSNYADRCFIQQFKLVTGRLNDQRIDFDVYFGIQTNKPSNFRSIDDDPDFQFLSEIPSEISGTVLEKLNKNIDIKIVAKTRTNTTDYVSAALRTKEKLDKFLDAATALEPNANVQISGYCAVINRTSIPPNKHALNVDRLLAFMSSEFGSSFSQQHPSIRQTFKGLNDTAKDQLGRSLRHLRLARNSVSLEQKLLNLWIALESLFSDWGTGILANILEFVPLIHATTGLRRRVTYLKDLLVANDISLTPLVDSNIFPGLTNFDDSITDHQIFLLLREERFSKILFESLGSREHLKFKLKQIHGELKNNKSTSDRLERSEDDVARQLRRIYFLRNKIAHTGHYKDVRPQLVTHLLGKL